MVTTQHWETIYQWKSDHWDKENEWIEAKMTEELDALEEFRRTKLFFKFNCLASLVDAIENDEKIKVKNFNFNFSILSQLFSTWRHLTTNCSNYGTVWVAQDESYPACFMDEKRRCNGKQFSCKEYKKMIQAPILEEMVKKSSKVNVQFT
jgi:hypothetical protein